MDIEMTRGCVCDWLGIDQVREVDMTDEQKQQYFKQICDKLPELDQYGWFNMFLQWVCEEYGDYDAADKPCECCGDIIETYSLKI